MQKKNKPNSDDKKNSSYPGWLNLDKYDFFLSLFLIWFLIAITIMFNFSEALNKTLNIQFSHEKLLFVYISFIILFIFTKTLLSLKEIGKLVLRFFGQPAYIIYYFSSFLSQCWKTFKHLKQNAPVRITFFLIIPIMYGLGIYSDNKTHLEYLFDILSCHLLISLCWSLKWSLKPFNFLKYTKLLKKEEIQTKIASSLIEDGDKKNSFDIKSILKNLTNLGQYITVYDQIIKFILSSSTLFSLFSDNINIDFFSYYSRWSNSIKNRP